MIRALWTGATGMKAQQFMIDTIANNLANVNTTGYKRQRVQFQDLYYETLNLGQSASLSVGSGTRVTSTDRSFRQGNIEKTEDPLNVAIEGQGFFAVRAGNDTFYTRDGSFRLDGQGYICTSHGYRVVVDGASQIPGNVSDLEILTDGTIQGVVNGQRQKFGTIRLTIFPNPAGLEAVGGNLFRATETSGQGSQVTPGQSGSGILRGGYLETSNVEIVTEMVNLIVAQRAFELNSKTVETADQMWGIANNIRR